MLLLFLVLATLASVQAVAPVKGTKCAPNQVINRLTVFEDGSLEVECGPMPCGQSAMVCKEETTCRAETSLAHGIHWAVNGKSLLLRCCNYHVSNKIYVGTDVVTYGSYYQGGAVASKDQYEKEGGAEYDFIANLRAEQGGVRVWVYRIMCNAGEGPGPFVPEVIATSPASTTTTTAAAEGEVEVEESNDEEEEEVAEQQDEAPQEEEKPFNPLRYRPPSVQRASTGVHRH